MKFIKGFFTLLLRSFFMSAVFTLSLTVFAEEMSAVDSESMEKTIELLNNRAQRQEKIDSSPDAKKANDMAKKLFGDGADLNQVYKVAGELFRKLATDNNGNSISMMEILSNAQSNPEEFFKNMTPEQQEMIRSLGKKVEDKRKPTTP